MISTRLLMPTGSCVCRRLQVSRRRLSGCSNCLRRRSVSRGRRRRLRSCWSRREQEEEPRRLVAGRVLQAALRAVREPAVRLAHLGRPADGFSALVNYHRLDRKTLEKLTYTYLGQDWVERQRAGVRDEVAGAEARLAAALELQRKLEAILEGEKPFDIYVRWKELHEQPVGWEPGPQRRRAPKHPAVRRGRRAAVAVQHPLEEGPRQEPRRLRTTQRHPPHARREAATLEKQAGARERDCSRPLVARLAAGARLQRQRAASRRCTAVARRAARNGSRSSSGSRERLPVVTPRRLRPRRAAGPAYWMRCVVARHDRCSGSQRPPDRLPAGVARSELRAVESCPAELGADRRAAVPEPVVLASQWQADWTVRSLLTHAERGLGLRVADDAETARRCCLRSTGFSISRRPAREAGARCRLLPRPRQPRPSPKPARLARRSRRVSGSASTRRSGRRSCSSARRTTASIPCAMVRSLPRESSASARASGRRSGSDSPTRPSGTRASPSSSARRSRWSSSFEHVDAWPQDNEIAEDQLRNLLRDFEVLTAEGARKEAARLDAEHAWRRGTVWADLDLAPLAFALEQLALLAELTAQPLAPADLDVADGRLRRARLASRRCRAPSARGCSKRR